ncbi:UdgX family uracil-DNA binding protein [Rhizobacter sp. J219]|uniref:UdgX family uracil-DNA binding protein n=1 Tax=Rhizobacter sp. J219 TaxID=2898430 RepID=UPI002150E937|nr:UdgX family uracil-DNA binding protein [Rhizobacter sp. J219]MCR5885411.1 UdgX family uracil-DNA binding protein [Rhizobacter sp. J219]
MSQVHIALEGETDWDGFRAAARRLLAQGVSPDAASWSTGTEADLFDMPTTASTPGDTQGANATVPAAFIDLCERVRLHREPSRFALMYRLLWRLQHEPALRHDPLDADLLRAQAMAKAVSRDLHKMRAFVRFRPVHDGLAEPLHVAWFEPEHHIVEANAPFFMRRFTHMRWAILTPRRSVRWDGRTLTFGPGAARSDAPSADAGEALWLTYYRHIFNPARLKLDQMRKEMPRRYWRNLPEAELITELTAQALPRTGRMVDAPPTVPRRRIALLAMEQPVSRSAASKPLPNDPQKALAALRVATDRCRECPIGEHATQSVFGEGPVAARLMVVGEQPGDKEDLQGRPFVGPAGHLFDKALEELGWDRSQIYVTNAVKHFKYELRGQRRIHKTPTQHEAAACLHWLESEIEQVKPQALIALGATATRSLIGHAVPVLKARGTWLTGQHRLPVLVTVHPSALLRGDPAQREDEYRQWLADLSAASRYITSGS